MIKPFLLRPKITFNIASSARHRLVFAALFGCELLNKIAYKVDGLFTFDDNVIRKFFLMEKVFNAKKNDRYILRSIDDSMTTMENVLHLERRPIV